MVVVARLQKRLGEVEDVFIAIGSNLGDRLENIARAEQGLSESVEITGRSQVYETPPQYVVNQPSFLNLAVRGTPKMEPRPLLEALKRLEVSLGRQPGPRNGPRLIDLDILCFGERQIDTDELTLPHPRIQERYFVLQPLLDLDPNMRHPTIDKTMRQLLNELPMDAGQGVKVLPDY
jgi:2-amino-4-hydroxy-6-hydroxymethyldihydropteridine diphosphokinase